MQATLRALLALQELDSDLFRVREELLRLPAERARASNELENLARRLQQAQAESRELRVRIKEIEDHTTLQRQRLRKIEGEANNSRGDMALLAAYQHEIRSLKRLVSEAEEEGLALVEKGEQVDGLVAELKSSFEKEQSECEALYRNIEQETVAAEERRRSLETEREKRLTSEVQPEVLAIYNRLLAARGGVAMAELDGRICQGCFMGVPTNSYVRVTRGAEIIQCPSCDRILYQRS
jgi:predicted  nucleic acid-binding Zn-ribbon protein